MLAGISTVLLVGRRKCPALLVGWLWYLGMLVPVIGLVQVGEQSMADRYTYLPQIGLSIGLAWGAKRVVRLRPGRAWLYGVASSLTLAALMGCARRQVSCWRDTETMWRHALACTSQNALAHSNLAVTLRDQGRIDEAIAEFRKALEIEPDDAMVHGNLGRALAKQAKFDEARAEFREAIRIDPKCAEAHAGFGALLFVQGRLDQADVHFREALRLNPRCTEAHVGLGGLLSTQGQVAEAMAQWGEALRLQPENTRVLNIMARTLATCRQPSVRNGAAAVELARRAAELTDGRDPMILDTLAAAYAEAGRFSEAVQTARKALELAAEQNHPAVVESIRAKIPLYQSGSPYHETH